jgi:pimeloyl-ACP methyl ester carboxylesterase
MLLSHAAAAIAEIDHAGTRRMSTCGAGEMIWRCWGEDRWADQLPIVLVHGDTGSWTHWIRNIPVLARQMRVITPDMPGYGISAIPPEPWSAESIAGLLAVGLDAVLAGAPRYHLAGFSFGGIIAGNLAALDPERVLTLTQFGPGGWGIPAGPNTPPLPRLHRVSPDMTLQQIREVHRHNLSVLMIGDPAAVDDLAIDVQIENVRQARLRAGGIPASDALVRVLPRIRAPIATFWGGRDAFFRSDAAKRRELLHAAHPDASIRMIPGVGHWTPYEAADVVNATLVATVKR